MTDIDIEKIEVHEIDISFSNDEILNEEDVVEITLKKNEITKIIVTPKSGNPTVVFNDAVKPIKPSLVIPIKPGSRSRVVVWDLPGNSLHINRIARYKSGKNDDGERVYVYTFHWHNPSVAFSGSNFFVIFLVKLLTFFLNLIGPYTGKSGSGGGLQR